ncbi:MAG: SDR family oxidoreductase [Spirochaetes bacterium]|nr:SDR family oxidoreductase [Spirochaetota bacterium]
MKVLIIGASGYIGSNLKKHFEKKGIEVIGTTFPEKIEGLKFFNSVDSDFKDLDIDLKEIKYAIICSGISNINECKMNSEMAYKINVSGNKKIIQQCFKYGIVPVFLSSDAVFDGLKGNYTELDETNPCNEYGKHKKAIEDYLIKSKEEYIITRLSKVFGTKPKDGTFITSLVSQLKEGKVLNCAIDQIFCPVHIEDLVNLFYLACEKNLRGLYNFCSTESFSRYELANLLKSGLDIKQGKIVKCLIKDINSLDCLPQNISMRSDKIIDALEYKFSKMSDHIKEIKIKIELY